MADTRRRRPDVTGALVKERVPPISQHPEPARAGAGSAEQRPTWTCGPGQAISRWPCQGGPWVNLIALSSQFVSVIDESALCLSDAVDLRRPTFLSSHNVGYQIFWSHYFVLVRHSSRLKTDPKATTAPPKCPKSSLPLRVGFSLTRSLF